ncbi:MAG: hypothetical protein CMJ08_04630 [Pelagibacterales bacterium]|nr:hypothetical protein [Pelagibacterales bacterium]
MQFKIVSTKKANSYILAHTIRLKDLVIRKGKVLEKEHIALLIRNNINQIYVAIIEKHDLSENLSVKLIAEHISPNSLFKIVVSNGRADIFSKTEGLLNINKEKLLKINAQQKNIAVCTLKNHSIVSAGQLVGNVKLLPYAIDEKKILRITNDLSIKRIFSISKKSIDKVGIIFTSNNVKNIKKKMLLKAVNSRLGKFNLKVNLIQMCKHNHKVLSSVIKKVLNKNIDLILVYGETSICDINDVVPKSIIDIKGKVISSVMPTDPGNLLLLGKINNITIIGVPGCAKSLQRNGFDDILERVCHGEKFNRKKIAEIADGGLYKNIIRSLKEEKIK